MFRSHSSRSNLASGTSRLEHCARFGRFDVARANALPDVPTLGEFIPGFEARTWQGLGAPKHLPTEIVDALNKEVIAALAEPALQARLADLGIAPMPLTPAECQTFITAEVPKWAKVIKFASIKPE